MSANDPKRTFALATMLSKAAPRRPAPRLSKVRTLKSVAKNAAACPPKADFIG